MSKVIIGIHGLGNKPSRELTEQWWKTAILEGFKNQKLEKEDLSFEMVYWADILYEKPLNEKIEDKLDPYYISERYMPYAPCEEIKPKHVRKKILDIIEKQLDKIFLDDDLSINFSFISDAIIHRYFKELEVYYSSDIWKGSDSGQLVRDAIRARLAAVLEKHKDDEILLIAHSMGSIIAYDVLTFLVPQIKIDTLVTIGSPLGLPVVIGKIVAERGIKLKKILRPKTPPGIAKAWYNFADLEDKVAIVYDLSENYDLNFNGVGATDIEVYNDYIINGERNPHKSFGYLRTPEMTRVLLEFLFRKEESTFLKFFKKFTNIFNGSAKSAELKPKIA